MTPALLTTGLVLLLAALLGIATLRSCPRGVRVPPGARPGDLRLTPSAYKTRRAAYRAEDGLLVVPENRQDPAPRLIALPVRRIFSSASHPAEPVFHLAGGPGNSNLGFRPTDALLAGHDVVLVGYRGVDGSSVLDSPEMAAAALGDGIDLTSPASLALFAAAMRAGCARLLAEGVDLSAYTVPEVVADLETARIALGYPRINLLSESYGTRVAQVYAWLHPHSLLRSAMIGVNPPGHFIWEPATIDAQLEQYSLLYAQDPAGRALTPNLAESLRAVARHMPRRWLGLPIDPGKVKLFTHVMLYHRATAALAFDAYLAAERGHPGGLALMSLAYDLVVPTIFTWGDLLAKGGSQDFDPARDYTDLEAPGSIIGSPMSLLVWGAAALGCPIYPVAAGFRALHTSQVETLLINGSLDFSTPLEFGRDELLPTLSRGQLVTLEGMGHVNDFWSINPPAADLLLTSFFATGQANAAGFAPLPLLTRVSPGFPLLAKLLAASGLFHAAAAYLWLRRRLTPSPRSLPHVVRQ